MNFTDDTPASQDHLEMCLEDLEPWREILSEFETSVKVLRNGAEGIVLWKGGDFERR